MKNASIVVRRLAGAVAVLGVAACADGPTSPAVHAAAPHGLNFSLIGQASTVQGDTLTTLFTVDPTSSTTFRVGSAHAIYFPAHSICDPAVSSYGVGEWDKSCTALAAPLVITAKSWVDAKGLPQVDFSPALRFAPIAGDGVQLALAIDTAKVGTAAVSKLQILYCRTPTEACIDEGAGDSTLTTWTSPFANAVYRRIKHFSGYNVSSGFLELPPITLSRSVDDSQDGEAKSARTGHLMSSGRLEHEP